MAVIDNIAIDRTAPRAGDLLSFVGAIKQVLTQGPVLLQQMNHHFDDSDAQNINWTGFAEYGVPTGKEQTVFDMCNGVMGVLEGTMQNDQAVNLVNRVG